MKLIFAVVHDDDTNKAVRHLNEQKFRVTRLSSTGGFLRKGKYDTDAWCGRRSGRGSF